MSKFCTYMRFPQICGSMGNRFCGACHRFRIHQLGIQFLMVLPLTATWNPCCTRVTDCGTSQRMAYLADALSTVAESLGCSSKY